MLLKEWLTKADGTVVALKDKTMRLTFYHTPDALWRLEKFLKDLGLEAEDDDQSIGDVEQMTPGRQVIIHVKHSRPMMARLCSPTSTRLVQQTNL